MDSGRSRRQDEHPDDEDPVNVAADRNILHPPTMTTTMKSASLQQQQQDAAPPPPPPPPPIPSSSSLASKPHAFHGSVLSPDHAKSLTCELVLQLSSALCHQATQAANAKGVLLLGSVGGSSILEESSSQQQQCASNIFRGSDVLDSILGWMFDQPNACTTSTSSSVAGGGGGGSMTSMMTPTPGTPKPNNSNTTTTSLPPQVLQLLRQGSTGSASGTMAASSSGIPQTPKSSSFTPTSSSSPILVYNTPNPTATVDGVAVSSSTTTHPSRWRWMR